MKHFVIGKPRRRRKTRTPAEMKAALDPKAIAASQPHRRAVAPEFRHDARAECALGVLVLNGRISDLQYRAGVALRDCVARYFAITGVPRHDRGATPLDGTRSKTGVMLDSTAQARKALYNRVYDDLINGAGIRNARAVTHLCVYDEPPSFEQLDGVGIALTRACAGRFIWGENNYAMRLGMGLRTSIIYTDQS